jgi:hypothetical protein
LRTAHTCLKNSFAIVFRSISLIGKSIFSLSCLLDIGNSELIVLGLVWLLWMLVPISFLAKVVKAFLGAPTSLTVQLSFELDLVFID